MLLAKARIFMSKIERSFVLFFTLMDVRRAGLRGWAPDPRRILINVYVNSPGVLR